MDTNFTDHNQQQCEHYKVVAVVHQIERCINTVISSEDPRVGSNWNFASDHKKFLSQLQLWFELYRYKSERGKKPERFPTFVRELHWYGEYEIIKYSIETWNQLTIFVQSLGNDSMLFAFITLFEYFDVEEEYSKDFE